jgi:hypothetical protein
MVAERLQGKHIALHNGKKGILNAILCCSTSFMLYDNLDQGHPDYNHRVYPFIFHHIDLVMMKIRPR